MTLYQLYMDCLEIKYSKVGKSSNYATKKEGKTLYIFFEKSFGLNDWRINFNFPAKAYKRMGKIVWFAHRGFMKVWKEIEPKICKEIADKELNKIIICGYSHGGGIAMLCHEYVWFNRPDLRENIMGYAFASPRVFWGINYKKTKERWANFLRIKNSHDIVTHLPPLLLGFRHTGKVLKIGKGKFSLFRAHSHERYLEELKKFNFRI